MTIILLFFYTKNESGIFVDSSLVRLNKTVKKSGISTKPDMDSLYQLLALGNMLEDQCIVEHTMTLSRFYAHESCGQCTPCREGTPWMYKILKKINNGEGTMEDIDLLWDIQRKIEGNTICPLGDAAAWPVAAAIRHFRDEFEWHVNNPKLSQTQNYGLAKYADPIPVVEKQA